MTNDYWWDFRCSRGFFFFLKFITYRNPWKEAHALGYLLSIKNLFVLANSLNPIQAMNDAPIDQFARINVANKLHTTIVFAHNTTLKSQWKFQYERIWVCFTAHICVRPCFHARMHVYVSVCICMCCLFVCAHVCVCLRSRANVYVSLCGCPMSVCISLYTRVHLLSFVCACIYHLRGYLCPCVNVCTLRGGWVVHLRICLCQYVYIRMRAWVCIYVYVCVHAHFENGALQQRPKHASCKLIKFALSIQCLLLAVITSWIRQLHTESTNHIIHQHDYKKFMFDLRLNSIFK